jgi:hypothetical protein
MDSSRPAQNLRYSSDNSELWFVILLRPCVVILFRRFCLRGVLYLHGYIELNSLGVKIFQGTPLLGDKEFDLTEIQMFKKNEGKKRETKTKSRKCMLEGEKYVVLISRMGWANMMSAVP